MSPPTTGRDVDFDLHGFVGVRVLDATERDVATVTRQLGPLRRRLDRDPDITVRFVDDLADGAPVTYAGWLDTGATERGFYVLRGPAGVSGRAAVPMADVGGSCALVCERRLGPVPHLLAIVNFTALSHGIVPLHASAFTYRGHGVLATGWAKGGKTEMLLAFARRGAHYVGDEWVYLSPRGDMYGVPEPIRLWQWQLRQLSTRDDGGSPVDERPGRPLATAGTRLRIRALDAVARRITALAQALPPEGLPASVLRRAAPVVARQAYVQVPPAELFGGDAVALSGWLDTVLFTTSTEADEVTVEPADPAEVGRRMLASLEDEREPFMAHYRQFRFLCPEATSDVVESAPAREAELVSAVLTDRPTFTVRHPYPLQIDSLVPAVESVLGH